MRQDGFVMHVVLENGIIFELDICASPATRLSLRQPERSSDLASCVTSRMISVTAIPLYEPPTFIGMKNGNIQILPHKYCRMSFFHAHSCSVVLLNSPIDFNEIGHSQFHSPVHPDVIMSCGSDGLIVQCAGWKYKHGGGDWQSSQSEFEMLGRSS
jgi:hypothetical protein